MDSKIEQFLMNLPEGKLETALQVRELFMGADKNMQEAIKWNNLTFMYNKQNIAFVYTYKQASYINVGFFRARHLNDPKGLLEGTGKDMLHIKLAAAADIPVTQLKKWIKETIALAGTAPPKKAAAKKKK